MKINGLNVKHEFNDEPSLEIWFKAFLDEWPERVTPQSLEVAKNLAKPIVDAYKQAEEYEIPIQKLKQDIDGNVILPEGTLLHATPPFLDKEKTIIDYEKLSSIGEKGLISLGMLDEEAYGWDQEVPLQVSFHRCSKSQTVEEKIREICALERIKSCGDIFFIVDVHNEGLKKLLSFDISMVRKDIDEGNGYRTEDDNFLAYRLKKYPEGIETETEKQTLGFLLNAGRPISEGPLYSYIPVAVPSKYITGIVLPLKLEKNENLIEFLSDNFCNATIISSDGKVINPLDREIS